MTIGLQAYLQGYMHEKTAGPAVGPELYGSTGGTDDTSYYDKLRRTYYHGASTGDEAGALKRKKELGRMTAMTPRQRANYGRMQQQQKSYRENPADFDMVHPSYTAPNPWTGEPETRPRRWGSYPKGQGRGAEVTSPTPTQGDSNQFRVQEQIRQAKSGQGDFDLYSGVGTEREGPPSHPVSGRHTDIYPWQGIPTPNKIDLFNESLPWNRGTEPMESSPPTQGEIKQFREQAPTRRVQEKIRQADIPSAGVGDFIRDTGKAWWHGREQSPTRTAPITQDDILRENQKQLLSRGRRPRQR